MARQTCRDCGDLLTEQNRTMKSVSKKGKQYYLNRCRTCIVEADSILRTLKKQNPQPAAGTPCACCGRIGRAKMRPFIRRSYENNLSLNPQLMSAILWWKKFLIEFKPRLVPASLKHMDVIISYSDGEGADAGVGVGVWSVVEVK